MNPFISGHRGNPYSGPENSISSVKQALSIGVDAVEIDVHTTKDKRIVVIHDDKVDRTTDGKGYVKNFTLKQLKKLKLRIPGSKRNFSSENIPTLQEIINVVKGKVKLIIEVKENNLENQLIKIIEKNKITNSTLIISFYHKIIKKIKKIDKRIKTGILFVGNPIDVDKLAKSANADSIAANYLFVDKEMVKKAHKNKLKVFVWNIDTTGDLKRMLKLRVDGIGSNKPSTLIDYIKNKKIYK